MLFHPGMKPFWSLFQFMRKLGNGPLLLCFSVLLFSLGVVAQPPNDDCATAQQLCPNTSTNGTTENATLEFLGSEGDGLLAGTWGQCYDVNNSVWYTFRTNSSGGSATVTIANVNCINGNNLQAVMLEMGTACDPTTYSLQACNTGVVGGFSLVANGLAPNTTYWVNVDGAAVSLNGAECTFDITVTGPAVQWEVTVQKQDALCNGVNSGNIALSTSGGLSPYTYQWSNGATSAILSNLAPGAYTVTITDAATCDTVLTVIIDVMSGITDMTLTPVNASCSANDGSITVSNIVGGTTPYEYSIDGTAFQTSNVLGNLSSGVYTVTVRDSNDCIYTENTAINQPQPPTGQLQPTPSSCNEANGSLTAVNVTGGTPPYQYGLLGGSFQSSEVISNLAPGTYSVVIIDDSACLDTVIGVVTDAGTPQAELIPTQILCEQENGNIMVTEPSGGVPPYTYSLNGGAPQTDRLFSELTNGLYNVLITDNQGCDTLLSTVVEDECPPVEVFTALSPNGDGFNETWNILNIEQYPDNKVFVYDRWGQPVFREEGYKNKWDGTNLGYKLPDGTYYYVVFLDKDDKGLGVFTGNLSIIR